jgi:hypothetical protein
MVADRPTVDDPALTTPRRPVQAPYFAAPGGMQAGSRRWRSPRTCSSHHSRSSSIRRPTGRPRSRPSWSPPWETPHEGRRRRQTLRVCGLRKSLPFPFALLRALIARHDIDLDKVTGIDVAVVHLTPKILIHTNPTEGLQGKFSMQYCMARALTSRFLGVGHFTDEAVSEPGIRHLMGLVNMHVDADLDAAWTADRPRPVTLTVTLADGTALQQRVDIPTGLPEKPATAAQVEAKYRDLAVPVLGDEDANRVIDLARNLASLPDVTALMSACARCEAGCEPATSGV